MTTIFGRQSTQQHTQPRLHKVSRQWYTRQFAQMLRVWSVENNNNHILLPASCDAQIKYQFVRNPDGQTNIGLSTNYYDASRVDDMRVVFANEQVEYAYLTYRLDSDAWIGLWFDKSAHMLTLANFTDEGCPPELMQFAQTHQLEIRAVVPSSDSALAFQSVMSAPSDDDSHLLASWQVQPALTAAPVCAFGKVMLGHESSKHEFISYANHVSRNDTDAASQLLHQWRDADRYQAKHLIMNDFADIRVPVGQIPASAKRRQLEAGRSDANSNAIGGQQSFRPKNALARSAQGRYRNFAPSKRTREPELRPDPYRLQRLQQIRHASVDAIDKAIKRQGDYIRRYQRTHARGIYDEAVATGLRLQALRTATPKQIQAIYQGAFVRINHMHTRESDLLRQLKQGLSRIFDMSKRMLNQPHKAAKVASEMSAKLSSRLLSQVEARQRVAGAQNPLAQSLAAFNMDEQTAVANSNCADYLKVFERGIGKASQHLTRQIKVYQQTITLFEQSTAQKALFTEDLRNFLRELTQLAGQSELHTDTHLDLDSESELNLTTHA